MSGGVSPATAPPKLRVARSSEIDSAGWRLRSTVALCVAPAEGTGLVPHARALEEDVRGVGAAAMKSAELESVSTQPPLARTAAVELVSTGAGADPSKSLAGPYPTRSWTSALPLQLPAAAPQVSGVASRTSATLPPETARFVVPMASGVGSGAPTAAADANCTR